MEQKVAKAQQRILNVMVEELQGLVNEAVRGMLDPDIIMQFVRSMGFDPSQFPGMMGSAPGFDPYQVLGLDRTATDAEVKNAYREQMAKLHPDVAGRRFNFLSALVNIAYQQIGKERGWK